MSEHKHISVATYTGIFVALLALLALTVFVAKFNFGMLNLPIAMAIAGVKAALIVLFFMHVKVTPRLIFFLFAGSLYVLLLGAIILFSDYMSR